MSRIYIEGFEAGGIQPPVWNPFTIGQTAGTTPPTIVATPAAGNVSKGEKCLRVKTGGGDYAWFNVGHFGEFNGIYMKMRYYHPNTWYQHTLFRFWSERMELISYLFWISTGQFRYYGDVNYSGIISTPNTTDWHVIELWLKTSTAGANTDGEIELRVDGVPHIANYAARTNQLDYFAKINKIQFGGGSYSTYAYYDDLIIDSTSTLNVNRNSSVVGYELTSDSTKNWSPVPTSANNYSNITFTGNTDEQDADSIDGDYISADSTGVKDIYTVAQDFSPGIDSSSSVKCMQLQVRGRRHGPCPAVYLRPFVELNSSEYSGNIIQPPYTNFQTRYSLWEQNPDSSVDWTVDDLDNMKVGVEST